MKKSELKQIIKEEIRKVLSENRYEIIDLQPTEQSLKNILDAISLLNKNGLKAVPKDKSGHYSGGYKHINSIYFTSPMSFDELIIQANDVLFKNDMKHLRIIKA
jgi:hypothetical protein